MPVVIELLRTYHNQSWCNGIHVCIIIGWNYCKPVVSPMAAMYNNEKKKQTVSSDSKLIVASAAIYIDSPLATSWNYCKPSSDSKLIVKTASAAIYIDSPLATRKIMSTSWNLSMALGEFISCYRGARRCFLLGGLMYMWWYDVRARRKFFSWPRPLSHT